MALVLTSDQNSAITSYQVRSYYLVSIKTITSGGLFTATDFPTDITIDNITYNSNGGLAAVSRPQHQSSADRDAFSIAFSDNSGALRRRIVTSGIRGLKMITSIVFFGVDDSMTSPLKIYTGWTAGVVWKKERDGYRLIINFTGQLAQLDASYSVSTTPASQEKFDPTDTCMDFTHETVRDQGIKWGKE